MSTFRTALCAFVLALLGAAPLALAQGTYTQIDYPGAVLTQCNGINNLGDIVGFYLDTNQSWHGFLLSAGNFTVIDDPGSSITWPYGVNDLGQIVGFIDSPPLGFLYEPESQTFSQISYPGAVQTVAFSINNAGAIVGYLENDVGRFEGFETIGSAYRKIGTSQTGIQTLAVSITASGEVVGNVITKQSQQLAIFSFEGGTYRRVTIPNAPNAAAVGIDGTGKAIVGDYLISGAETVGFLYSNNVLQTLQFPGSIDTFASGVNVAGEVVGSFQDTSDGEHCFTWTPGTPAEKK